MASDDTDLPQPDSPTIATDLAAVDRVGNAVDRVHDAARGVELHVQILHREQRCRRAGSRGGVRRRRGPSLTMVGPATFPSGADDEFFLITLEPAYTGSKPAEPPRSKLPRCYFGRACPPAIYHAFAVVWRIVFIAVRYEVQAMRDKPRLCRGMRVNERRPSLGGRAKIILRSPAGSRRYARRAAARAAHAPSAARRSPAAYARRGWCRPWRRRSAGRA